jgi:hypothetical protein
MPAAATWAAPSANTPAFGVPTLFTSPTAYTLGKRVSSVCRFTGSSEVTRLSLPGLLSRSSSANIG